MGEAGLHLDGRNCCLKVCRCSTQLAKLPSCGGMKKGKVSRQQACGGLEGDRTEVERDQSAKEKPVETSCDWSEKKLDNTRKTFLLRDSGNLMNDVMYYCTRAQQTTITHVPGSAE